MSQIFMRILTFETIKTRAVLVLFTSVSLHFLILKNIAFCQEIISEHGCVSYRRGVYDTHPCFRAKSKLPLHEAEVIHH